MSSRCKTSGMCLLLSEITPKRSRNRAEWSSRAFIDSEFGVASPLGRRLPQGRVLFAWVVTMLNESKRSDVRSHCLMGYCFCRSLPCLVVLFLFAVAAAASGKRPAVGDQEVVIVPVANMYSSATENTDVVSQAILGTDVVLL